ncbi:hypothetical protein P8452_55942 [Trifolium repens]|nr:hypothetical protein P8452_55942 [Trifolium repens]
MEKKHEILEIGCGWGSLAIEDVKRTGCNSNLQKKELKMLAFSYSFSMITTFEQLKFAEERVKDVDIQVISHETSLVARCRRVYAHAHDYHINSISNNRHLKCKKLEGCCLGIWDMSSLLTALAETEIEESDYVQVGMNVAYMKSPLELLEESKVHMQKGNFIHQLSRFYASKLSICT